MIQCLNSDIDTLNGLLNRGIPTEDKIKNEIEIKTAIIETLKAEPCEDAVSREAVNDFCHKVSHIRFGGMPLSTEWYAQEDLQKYFDKLPPVQPESRWIPISKRLPEKGEEVIVTTRYRFFDQDKDEHDIKMLIYTGKDELGHTFLTHSGSCERNIIAWMPKPVSYKKGENK